ncbi:sigma factor [Paenibacillus sp. FSL H8-0259]|uniref:sigma factor n=1 Tax=Paenibacillus sp. FSL H8-0259 TaxID=1920423 RepID=UPI0009FA6B39|nr:sigma factor [Paenibacillus sp. FSL H8-0259]
MTQETFVKAVKNINQFKGNCKISVWLCQIAKNTYFTYMEKQKRRDPAEPQEKLQVIKSRKFAELGLGNRYDTIDLELLNANGTNPSTQIKAIYYGPKDNNPILIWKQGMDLPPATAAVEAQFAEQN